MDENEIRLSIIEKMRNRVNSINPKEYFFVGIDFNRNDSFSSDIYIHHINCGRNLKMRYGNFVNLKR